jgi:hypothetical protein
MKLSYTLTLDDYKAALRLHRRQKLSRRILPAVAPVLAGLGLVATLLFEISGQSELALHLLGLDVVFLSLSIALPLARLLDARMCFKRIFPQTKTVSAISADIDDERIFCKNPGVSEGKFFWNAIVNFTQDEKMTLLYLDKDKFLLFPTQAMSPEQRAELNDLIARHVVGRKS